MIFKTNVTFYGQDADKNGHVRPAILLDRMEAAGTAQMEAYPPSNDDLAREGRAFLLSRIVLEFHKPVHLGAAEVETFATDSRALSFGRCYRLFQDGTCAVDSYSVWALYDVNTGRPVRVSDVGVIGGEPNPPVMPRYPLRVAQPSADAFETLCTRKVYRSDADRNGHLNNTKYLNFLCDALPTDLPLRGANLAFVHEAPLGETLIVSGKRDGDTWYVKSHREDGSINCEAVLYF